MAKVPLIPLGSPVDAFLPESDFERNHRERRERDAVLAERRAAVHGGWGEKYVERVHKKGKLTTRERIERLKDDGSELFEVGTFVNWGRTFGKVESPAAGVVTVFARCTGAGRW